jgi:hypothetical protein
MNRRVDKITIFWLLCFFYLSLNSQKNKQRLLQLTKIGVLYSTANEKNFLFDDPDYAYSTNSIKLQVFYRLGSWKSFHFEWSVQPQVHFLKHQLFNEQFVLPIEDDYEQKRSEFTQLKTMHLYAFEIGVSVSRELVENLNLQANIGLGVATIDKRTERVAKGFTFIESGAIGFLYSMNAKTSVYLGCAVGHVSNFDTQEPNSGYNTFGFEIGFQYQLN